MLTRTSRLSRLSAVISGGLAALILLACSSSAQDAVAPKPDETDVPALQSLAERLAQVEEELARLRSARGLPPKDEEGRVVALVEAPYLGSTYHGSPEGVRFFAARLILVNLTPEPVIVNREDIRLFADGAEHTLDEVSKKIEYQSYQVGNQSFQIRNMEPAAQMRLAPAGSGSTWVVFSDLPPGPDVPSMILKTRIGDEDLELDINEFSLGMLGLDVQRVGPRGALGLITIANRVDTINVGSLVDTLEELAENRVGRAVIRWTDSAAPLDRELSNWLEQAARQAGLGNVDNARFPVIPASIRELHLAEVPNDDEHDAAQQVVDNPYHPGPENRLERIHDSDAAAISAALQSAYEVLPLEELLAEIQNSDPLIRAAALAAGGGRLPSDKLPLLLDYADDGDPRVQQAALTALRHFGEPAAVDKLLHHLRKGVEPLATTAIESLAGSRYAAAHDALLGVLENETPESKQAIVRVLARYPRPIWSETIYEFAQTAPPGVGADALRALMRIGHPKLLEVLKRSLYEGDEQLQNEAFELLVQRTDPASQEMALDYALERMKESPPTQEMTNLLNKTRDPRAVPLLLKHFEDSNGNRSTIINTLALIGDETVADVIVEKYPGLRNFEQSAALQALQQLRSPAFRKLAGQALLTSDSSLINAACQGLQAEASPEAIHLLAAALDESNSSQAWSYLTNALATLGTPEARHALRRAKESQISDKRNFAANALRNMQRRSPGWPYVYRASQYAQEQKWKDAVSAYAMALKLDPDLIDAYVGRGNAYLHQEEYKEARKDFTKSLELDSLNSEAVTGLAIVLVHEESFREGVRYIEDLSAKFPNDHIFAYNSACVYGLAIDQLEQQAETPERKELVTGYQRKALAALSNAVKWGFDDLDWMKEDPDLESLHELSEFEQIHSPNGVEEEAAPEADGLIENPF